MLDSHAFVWMHEEPQKLSVKVAAEILNPSNRIYLSAASIWELQIKIKIGKFTFNDTLENVIAEQRRANGLKFYPSISNTLCISKIYRFITKTRSTGCLFRKPLSKI